MRRVSTAPASGGAEVLAGKRPRRALGEMFLHVPQTLRALVRADEIWLVVLAAFLGCATGIAVWMMTETTQLIHETLFGISPNQRLSAMASLEQLASNGLPSRSTRPFGALENRSKIS